MNEFDILKKLVNTSLKIKVFLTLLLTFFSKAFILLIIKKHIVVNLKIFN